MAYVLKIFTKAHLEKKVSHCCKQTLIFENQIQYSGMDLKFIVIVFPTYPSIVRAL